MLHYVFRYRRPFVPSGPRWGVSRLARKRTIYSRQRALEQELKKGLAELKTTRSTLKDAEARAMEGFYLKPPPPPKISNVDYRRMAKLQGRLGLYNPKWDKARTLTTARKRAIRAHQIELEQLTKNSVFALYPDRASPKLKKQIAGDVRRAYPKITEDVYGQPTTRAKGGKVTKRGIFIPKSPNQMNAPVGELRFHRETGVYGVMVKKKTKEGLMASEFRFIAGSEVLEIKKEKLQKHIDKARKLKKNERLRFIIGKNESRRVFRNMAQLIQYASRYRSDDQARATFLNELMIATVSKGEPRIKWIGKGRKKRKVKDPWTKRHSVFRASNYHDVDPDIVAEMLDYDDVDDE